MIVYHKETGAVARLYLPEAVEGETPTPLEQWLLSEGLTAAQVDVYTDTAAFEASTDGAAVKAAKDSRKANSLLEQAALEAAAAKMPTLANSLVLATLYMVYPAVDGTKLDTVLVEAVSAYAVAKGLPDVTGLT